MTQDASSAIFNAAESRQLNKMSTKKTISPIPRLSLPAIHGDNSTGPHFDTDDMGMRLVFLGIMIEVSLHRHSTKM